MEGTPKKFPPGPVEWVTAVRKPRKYRLGWFKRKAYPGNYPKGSPPHPAPRRGHPLQQERAWGFPVGMYGHPYYSGQLVFGRLIAAATGGERAWGFPVGMYVHPHAQSRQLSCGKAADLTGEEGLRFHGQGIRSTNRTISTAFGQQVAAPYGKHDTPRAVRCTYTPGRMPPSRGVLFWGPTLSSCPISWVQFTRCSPKPSPAGEGARLSGRMWRGPLKIFRPGPVEWVTAVRRPRKYRPFRF